MKKFNDLFNTKPTRSLLEVKPVDLAWLRDEYVSLDLDITFDEFVRSVTSPSLLAL